MFKNASCSLLETNKTSNSALAYQLQYNGRNISIGQKYKDSLKQNIYEVTGFSFDEESDYRVLYVSIEHPKPSQYHGIYSGLELPFSRKLKDFLGIIKNKQVNRFELISDEQKK
jgi:hypothetical protein